MISAQLESHPDTREGCIDLKDFVNSRGTLSSESFCQCFEHIPPEWRENFGDCIWDVNYTETINERYERECTRNFNINKVNREIKHAGKDNYQRSFNNSL